MKLTLKVTYRSPSSTGLLELPAPCGGAPEQNNEYGADLSHDMTVTVLFLEMLLHD
jgi:hypothetical protein